MTRSRNLIIAASLLTLATVAVSYRYVGACECGRPMGDAFLLEIESVTYNGQSGSLDKYLPYEVILSGQKGEAKFWASDPKGHKQYEVEYVTTR